MRLWWFLRPERMACSTGYLIPISHEIESFLASHSSLLLVGGTASLSSSPARSACNFWRYCRCPSRTWWRRMHKNTSLLLVQAATFLQKSMWQCSGPCVLKFSDHLKSISSRTLWRILCAFSNFHAFTFFSIERIPWFGARNGLVNYFICQNNSH